MSLIYTCELCGANPFDYLTELDRHATIILFLFLGNIRGAIIVTLTIPFALMFAAICLDLSRIPANLLSLGALDFGMLVDGSVVMIENIIRRLAITGDRRTPAAKIQEAAHEVQEPVFFARAIVITSYLPIFTLQAVEGRLFKPMAWTVWFALFGALVFSIVVAPVGASFLFGKGARDWHNPLMVWLTDHYRVAVRSAIEHRYRTVGIAAVLFAVAALPAGGRAHRLGVPAPPRRRLHLGARHPGAGRRDGLSGRRGRRRRGRFRRRRHRPGRASGRGRPVRQCGVPGAFAMTGLDQVRTTPQRMQPLIITVAPVGAELTRSRRRTCPTRPRSSARPRPVRDAGASIVHVHCRNDDGTNTHAVSRFADAYRARYGRIAI